MDYHVKTRGSMRFLLMTGVLLGLICLVLAQLFYTRSQNPDDRKRVKNVLLISIDTLRPDHLSCYGYHKDTSPHIDALAAKSQRFTRAYTPMPTTLPAHTSLLTSLYPTQLGVKHNFALLSEEIVTLPEMLAQNQITTAGFVSSAVLDKRTGFGQGFQFFDDTGKARERIGGKTVARCLEWLKKNKQEPFFLFLHLYDPHIMYSAPAEFRERFGVKTKKLPKDAIFVPVGSMDPDSVAESIKAYDAEIAYADAVVGRLLTFMQDSGLDENTAILITSDHGESLDELLNRFSYVFDHGEFLYQHQIQVPLILYLPGEQSGRVQTAPVSLLDVTPTILELLGLPPARIAVGTSLLPLLESKEFPERPIFSNRRHFDTAPLPFLEGDSHTVVADQWQFIYAPKAIHELYHLGDDPGQVKNLTGERPRELDSLQQLMDQWRQANQPLFGDEKVEMDPKAIEMLEKLGYTK